MSVENEITEAAVTAAVADVKADVAIAETQNAAADMAVILERIAGIERNIDALSARSYSYDDSALRAEMAAIRESIAAMEEEVEEAEETAEEAVEAGAMAGGVVGGLVAEDVVDEAPAAPPGETKAEEPPAGDDPPETRSKRKRHFLR